FRGVSEERSYGEPAVPKGWRRLGALLDRVKVPDVNDVSLHIIRLMAQLPIERRVAAWLETGVTNFPVQRVFIETVARAAAIFFDDHGLQRFFRQSRASAGKNLSLETLHIDLQQDRLLAVKDTVERRCFHAYGVRVIPGQSHGIFGAKSRAHLQNAFIFA